MDTSDTVLRINDLNTFERTSGSLHGARGEGAGLREGPGLHSSLPVLPSTAGGADAPRDEPDDRVPAEGVDEPAPRAGEVDPRGLLRGEECGVRNAGYGMSPNEWYKLMRLIK